MGGDRFVYGETAIALDPPEAAGVQTSPLLPGAAAIEAVRSRSAASFAVAAPPGTLERRAVLAHALRALQPGGELVAFAPKDKGGARLHDELVAFGCAVEDTARRHMRVCRTVGAAAGPAIEAAIEAGAPRFERALGLWTQPGVFSWDRPDPGTRLLLETLTPLAGAGADLGCGLGPVALAVLASPAVTALSLVDLDRRAVDAARRNVRDPRAAFVWADARTALDDGTLDFVVTNPPFHDRRGTESRELGQAFIRAAHRLLRKGGVLRLVANRHLPYEAPLGALFPRVAVVAARDGFKVLEARR